MKNRSLFIIIVGAVTIIAVFAVLSQSKNQSSPQTFDDQIEQIEQQSTSNEPDVIEQDLNETDLSDIDKELQDIESELNAAY